MNFIEIKADHPKRLININDVLLIEEDFETGYSLIYVRTFEEPLKVKIHFSTLSDKINGI